MYANTSLSTALFTALFTAFITLLALSPAQVYASKSAVIYRWLDENNVAHFSQSPPPEADISSVIVEVAYRPAAKTESKNEPIPNDLTKAEKDKNCLSAKNNLRLLSEYTNISFKDSMGKKRLLTEKEKAEHLSTNQEIVDVHCENK